MRSFALMIPLATLALASCQNGGDTPTAGSTRADDSLIGKSATDFTLTDSKGQSFALSGALGKGPIVLVFYRGDW